MRLIDADELIDRYNKEIPYALAIEEVVAKVPTSYDIDKVVKELEENIIDDAFKIGKEAKVWNNAIQEAIDIVKAGGKE